MEDEALFNILSEKALKDELTDEEFELYKELKEQMKGE